MKRGWKNQIERKNQSLLLTNSTTKYQQLKAENQILLILFKKIKTQRESVI